MLISISDSYDDYSKSYSRKISSGKKSLSNVWI